jgi:chorismate dehydratase
MTMTKSESIVFGASAYANAAPLCQVLPRVCPAARLALHPPSALPDLLRGGAVDVGLVPVIALLRGADLEALPGLGVCARERVRSVLLKLGRPAPEVRRVAGDPASQTSNVLARLLLERRYGARAAVVAANGARVDAAVAIGDRALCEPPAPCGDLDLASEWHALTGLPFVFAVWACRAGDPRAPRYARAAAEALEAGLAELPRIMDSEAKRLGLPLASCRDYFTRCIYYRVGPEEQTAIRRFGEMIA